jgi:hypothetical protein
MSRPGTTSHRMFQTRNDGNIWLKLVALFRILERISRIFQDHGLAYEHGRSGRQVVENDRNRIYQEVLAIDRDIDNYLATLPACFSLDPTKSNLALEQQYPRLPFYRSLITGAINFHRILMHRPFMLKPIRRKRHPYRYSWQKCVEAAVQDLRARTVWQKTLTPAEQVSIVSREAVSC